MLNTDRSRRKSDVSWWRSRNSQQFASLRMTDNHASEKWLSTCLIGLCIHEESSWSSAGQSKQKKMKCNGEFLKYVALQKRSVQWVEINEQWNNCKCIQGCWFDLITGISNRHKAEERWSNTVKEPLAKNGLIWNAAVRGPQKFSSSSVTVCLKSTNIKQNGGVFMRSWANFLFGSIVVGMKTSICRNSCRYISCSSTCFLDLSPVKLLLLTQNIRVNYSEKFTDSCIS